MALTLKQQLKLAQQLVMTPQLQQAIKLLQLSRLELAETLRQEIEENPLLEEITAGESEGDLSPGTTTRDDKETPESEKTGEISMESVTPMQEINWEDYANYYEGGGFSFSREVNDSNRPSRLDFVSKKTSLQSHLQWQLSHKDLTKEEVKAGLFIIGNLNPQGFLELTKEDIVEEIGCSEDTADHVLSMIQSMDPAGVGGRDVKESLLLQLERLDLGESLAAVIIREHIHTLEIKKYGAIAKATRKPISEVLGAIKVITNLNPFPGRQYNDDDTLYIVPDVYIHKVGDDYLIVLNDEGLPRLRLSSHYQEILDHESDASKETKHYIKDKLKDAAWLINSIQQRQRTIYKVVESLLKFQKGFFEKGVSNLKPLVLRDVAEDIEMHESTISRVTTNKYVHTPQGIFELKYFFSTAIPRKGGKESLAAKSIKEQIRNMIKEEDPNKPLTDNAISEILQEEDIKIARRTIAKYREQLGILPVKHRRNPQLK